MWCYSFIPKYINNRIVIDLLDFLRGLWRAAGYLPGVHGRRAEKRGEHFALNSSRLTAVSEQLTAVSGGTAYYEKQCMMSDLPLGIKSMQYAGCGILALYNMIASFGEERRKGSSLPELIDEMERRGLVAGALFGTSPKIIERMLKERGFKTAFVFSSPDFERVFSQHDRFIMTFYHDGEDIRKQMHTVFVNRGGTGSEWIVHNAECCGSLRVSADSFHQMMSSLPGGRAKAICLISAEKDGE